MSGKTWIQDFEKFRSELSFGEKGALITQKRLKRAGIAVTIPSDGWSGVRREDDLAAIEGYSKENKDLFIKGWLWEHKRRRVQFTNAKDYRDSHPSVFVDEVTSFEKKLVTPMGYIFACSESPHRILGLHVADTRDTWWESSRFDKTRQITQKFFECSLLRVIDEEELIEKLRKLPSWNADMGVDRGGYA